MLETALVIGIVLTLLFATIEFGVLGFVQTAQDGAAFVAARTYAQAPSSGTSFAAGVAANVFTKVPARSIALAPGTSTVTSTVSSTQPGIPAPGAPSAVTLTSSATERMPAAARSGNDFSATATLRNYRSGSGTAYPSYAIIVAQTYATGNGKNGRFAEWYCRQKVYSGISFPSKRPANGGAYSAWDPITCNFIYSQIYAWDSGSTCS